MIVSVAEVRKRSQQYLKWGSYRHGYINIGVAAIESMLKADIAAIKVKFGDFLEMRYTSN